MTTTVSPRAILATVVLFGICRWAAVANGQTPAAGTPAPPPAAAPTDYSKVDIATTKIGSNFYAIDGSGGRMGALV